MTHDDPLPWERVLNEELESLHPECPSAGEVCGNDPDRLRTLYRNLLGQQHVALCLSGGGIRSASFCLGALQGLARAKILPHVDYLSTVSGGGYIAGWLAAWRHRQGDEDDKSFFDRLAPPFDHTCPPVPTSPCAGGTTDDRQLDKGTPSAPDGRPAANDRDADPDRNDLPFSPEPKPFRYLRTHTSYLAPRYGILLPDTWALIATYCRNLLLNWLILVPLFAAILMFPRLIVGLVQLAEPKIVASVPTWLDRGAIYCFVLAAFLICLSSIYTSVGLPSIVTIPVSAGGVQQRLFRWLLGHRGFLIVGLTPATFAFFLLCLGFAWCRGTNFTRHDDWWWFLLAAYLIAGATAVVVMPIYKRFGIKGRGGLSDWFAGILCNAIFGLGVWATLYYLYGRPAPQWLAPGEPPYLTRGPFFVCLAPSLLLVVGFLAGVVYIGFSSFRPGFSDDEDREWWARAGGISLLVAIIWAAASAVVLFGPMIFDHHDSVGTTYYLTAFGILAGLVSVIGGRSGSTPAKPPTADTRLHQRLAAPLLPIAALLCIFFLITLLSFATDRLLVHLADRGGDAIKGATHLARLSRTPVSVTIVTGLVLLGWSFVARRFINVNKFSLHATYRNRLIRAFLGASNNSRRAHPFTDFDPYDNLHLHAIRPSGVTPDTRIDIKRFNDPDVIGKPAAGHIRFLVLDAAYRSRCPNPDGRAGPTDGQAGFTQEELRGAFNEIIKNHSLHTDTVLAGLVNERVLDLLHNDPSCETPCPPANRLIIESALPGVLRPVANRPLHIINVALNLTRATRIVTFDRKAVSFTLSPFHCGSHELGYRPSLKYGGAISLGTAMTISGAAVNPNMGYHSSPLVTFLMTLFNARLGLWLGNPGECGNSTFERQAPGAFDGLLHEAFGITTERDKYVHLSDGGHFDNTGLYEMVLRRCYFIILCDASRDTNGSFDDLGNAIRRIRTDFGIPINLLTDDLVPVHHATDHLAARRLPSGRAYCAIGTIKYRDADRDAPHNGFLIYIKPILTRDSPRDVLSYSMTSKDFPHEPTSDQFFTEAQFECYRALGEFLVSRIADGRQEPTDRQKPCDDEPSFTCEERHKPLTAFWRNAKHVKTNGPTAGRKTGPTPTAEPPGMAEAPNKAGNPDLASAKNPGQPSSEPK